nr:retrovirus-related Pol polyprotein from transposon TNT 1-94 [Tanacetum cinerariifolium]
MSIEIQKKKKLLQQEQLAYLNTHPSKRLTSFCYNDDDDEDYTSAITSNEPVLSTEEPDNSLSMGDEHLDTIPAMESDKVIKSSVANLIPIPSESEGIPEHMCDVPSHDNSPPLDVSKDTIEDLFESNEEFSSIDDDSFSIDEIDYVEASPPDSELVSSEVMEIVIPEETNTFDNSLLEFETFCFDVEEISSGSTTTHPDTSLPEYEAFYDDHVKEISKQSYLRCSSVPFLSLLINPGMVGISSKAFRVFNTRRQQIKKTYHVTFDEGIEAIMFTNNTLDEIRIDDSSRYPPDEFLHDDDPFRQYQSNFDISYYTIPHGRSLTELTQEKHVSETLVSLLYEKIAIGSKWVLRNRKDEHGIVTKNKARLVAQGYSQEEGIDYEETFAPVARVESIKYATYMNFIVFQLDVKSAFLNEKLKEKVYLKWPFDFESSEFSNYVCKLDKALYGLKQAPKAWYLKGTSSLGLWYPKCSDFDLKGYSDSDYAGCNMDIKSTSDQGMRYLLGSIGKKDLDGFHSCHWCKGFIIVNSFFFTITLSNQSCFVLGGYLDESSILISSSVLFVNLMASIPSSKEVSIITAGLLLGITGLFLRNIGICHLLLKLSLLKEYLLIGIRIRVIVGKVGVGIAQEEPGIGFDGR